MNNRSNDSNDFENGSMANSFEEVKQLGRQMEKMRDGQQLERDKRIVDPVQSEDAPVIKQRRI